MLIKSDKYDKIVNSILYVSFFIHQFAFLFGASDLAHDHEPYHTISILLKILPFFVMLLTAFYYFLRGKFSIKEIIVYIIIAIPLFISLYNYRVVMVISNLFYVIIFKNVDAKKCIKIALYATVFGFLLNNIIGLVTPFTGNCTQNRMGVIRIRYGIGFYYGYMASYFYQTIVLTYLLAKRNIKWFEYLILMAFNVVVFIFCDTKAAFVYTSFALLLHAILLNANINILDKIFNVICILSYPCAAFISIFLPTFYNGNNKFYIFLNRILNGRLALTHNAFDIFGWKMFGQSGNMVNDTYYIDSAIGNMLTFNGLFILIMCILFMTLYCYMAVKVKDKSLMIVLSVLALSAIFDMGFMTMQLGPVIVLFYDIYNRFIFEKNKVVD